MTVERVTVERPIPGSGGTSGVGRDGVTTGSVSEDPDAPGGVTNEFEDELQALGVSHYWSLSEAAGTFADTGNVGGFPLTESSAGAMWRQAPSMGPRGKPLSYGLWSGTTGGQPFLTFAGGVAVAGHITGAWGCFYTGYDGIPGGNPAIESVPFSSNWNDNAGLGIRFRVQTNGAILFEIDGNSGRLIRKITNSSTYVHGQSYHLHCEQRADGTGLHLYINGVENTDQATTFAGGGVDIDSWVEEVMTALDPVASETTIGGERIGFSGTWKGVVGECYIFVNSFLGSANVASLFAKANTGAAPSDYHEFVADLGWADESMVIWLNGAYIGFNDVGVGGGIGIVDPRASLFGTPTSQQNALDNAGSGLEVVSDFVRYKQVYGSSNPVFFSVGAATDWEPTAGRTAGTWASVVTINGVPNGIRKIIWTFGTSQANSMELGVIGSVLGWQVFFRSFEASVETYRVLSGIVGLGSGPDFHMMTVTQPGDGSGPSLYLDDTDVTGVVGVSTNPDVWVPTYGDSSGQRWGGEQGSQTVDNWQPGHLHAQHGYLKVLTPAEITGLWNAVNGVF